MIESKALIVDVVECLCVTNHYDSRRHRSRNHLADDGKYLSEISSKRALIARTVAGSDLEAHQAL